MDVTLRVGERLPLLQDDRPRDLRCVLADEMLKLEHDLLAADDTGLRPSLEGLMRRFDSGVEL